MRYVGQSYEIEVPVEPDWLEAGLAARLLDGFHAAHERVFGHADPHAPVEIVNLRVQLRGVRPRVPLVEVAAGTGAVPTGDAANLARRPAGPRRACTSARASATVIAWPGPPSWSSRTRPCSSRRATSPTSTASAISSSSGRRDASRCPDPRAPPELSARRGRGHGLRRGAHRAHHVREGDGRLHLRPAQPERRVLRVPGGAGRGQHGGDQLRADDRAGGAARAWRRHHHQRPVQLARRRHPPARPPPRPPDLLGGTADRPRGGVPPLLGHRRAGAGEHLAARQRDLPGGIAPAAEEALRGRCREPGPPRRDHGELPHPRAELGRPPGAGRGPGDGRAAHPRADPALRDRRRRQGNGRPDRLHRPQGRGADPADAARHASSSPTTSRTTSSPTSPSGSRWR